jgi:hypothetical protein
VKTPGDALEEEAALFGGQACEPGGLLAKAQKAVIQR